MADYDNNLTGALFRNTKQREGKQDPDYRGQAEVNGVEFWLAAWVNKSDKVGQYLKLKFTAKDDQPAREPADDDGGDKDPFPF